MANNPLVITTANNNCWYHQLTCNILIVVFKILPALIKPGIFMQYHTHRFPENEAKTLVILCCFYIFNRKQAFQPPSYNMWEGNLKQGTNIPLLSQIIWKKASQMQTKNHTTKWEYDDSLTYFLPGVGLLVLFWTALFFSLVSLQKIRRQHKCYFAAKHKRLVAKKKSYAYNSCLAQKH